MAGAGWPGSFDKAMKYRVNSHSGVGLYIGQKACVVKTWTTFGLRHIDQADT